jgi:hypothetical protein
MKKIIFILIAIIASSSIASYASERDRWVLIARSANQKDFYVDSGTLQYQLLKKKLTMQEEQIALAWFKIVPNKKNKRTDSLIEKYINEEIGYATALIETNCSNSTLRVFVINIYDKDDIFAHRIETLTSKFEEIPAGTVFEDIKNIICKRNL